jgi:hypothetical protein
VTVLHDRRADHVHRDRRLLQVGFPLGGRDDDFSQAGTGGSRSFGGRRSRIGSAASLSA